jgi:AcrR family transcriptional regulator
MAIKPTETDKPRVGRPRRGTEAARTDMLIRAATRMFMREGYGAASIDKVAAEAGVSTRTIYERFKNKADLLGAVIDRLVEQDMVMVLAAEELDGLGVREGLTVIGRVIALRLSQPESAALFRICATESHRFPELAAKMRCNAKARIDDAVAGYMRRQTQRGALQLRDPDRAAVLFLHLVCADLQERLLFGGALGLTPGECTAHVAQVVDLFLDGALPRAATRVIADFQPQARES